MPIFVFKHPSTGKIIEVVQKMTEPHYFTDEEGVTWTRIFTIPRASVDSVEYLHQYQALLESLQNKFPDFVSESYFLS